MKNTSNGFVTVKQALNLYKKGHMLIIVDDENRENEGDLLLAGEYVTPQAINFMVTHGRGLICVALTGDRIKQLKLPMMFQKNPHHGTAFAVSVDAKKGVTTGISVYDRAKTIKVLTSPKTTPEDLVAPGHIFPLRAHKSGVLGRRGHTEAAVDLSILAGLSPVGVICEILNADGTMARLPDLITFSRKFSISMIKVAQIVSFRLVESYLIE